MKLDFLKSLNDLEPCGLRPIIDVLCDTHPVMAFSEWKELCLGLIDEGYVSKMANGQHKLTPAGREAIEKGESFLESNTLPDDEALETDEPLNKSAKPADDHPWKAPFCRNGFDGVEEQQRKTKPAKKQMKRDEPINQPAARVTKEVTKLDTDATSLTLSMSHPVVELSTDELLAECQLSKSIIDNLSQRRHQAIAEVSRRLGSGFFLEVRYHGEEHGRLVEDRANVT